VSAALTFGDVFTKACRARATTGISVAPAQSATGALAAFGSNSEALVFTSSGISFTDTGGGKIGYSWQQLDFILPGDLSLASDKLRTFTDFETPAARIARIVGFVFAIAGAAAFIFLIADLLYIFVISPTLWLHAHWGVFGDIIALLGICALGAALAPFVLPIVLGLLATGGAVSAIANWLGRQLRPLVRLVLSIAFRDAVNGLHIVGSDWVKMPWGPKAITALDLVFIGIKLSRRGFN
jgi:hypothetical protein